MKESFCSYHPVISFLHFFIIILITMFFMHPIILLISLISSISCLLTIKGKEALKFIVCLIPIIIIIALFNTIFNSEGSTVLFIIYNRRITFEALFYGFFSGIMLISVLIWFSCYNKVMSSDKIMYLFRKLIPTIALIICMVFRLIPKFKYQIKLISDGQTIIGKGIKTGKILEKIKNGLNIISILISWAFENSIETVYSMKARGYGLKGRSSFNIYIIKKRDLVALTVIIVLSVVIIVGLLCNEIHITFFPIIKHGKIKIEYMIICVAYGILCLISSFIND